MFAISTYSVFSTILFTGVFLLLFICLLNSNSIISKIPVWSILFIIILVCIRLLLPIEFLSVSESIDSFELLPALNQAVNTTVFYSFTIAHIIIALWLAGVVIALGVYIMRYVRFKGIFRGIPYSKDERLGSTLNIIKAQYDFSFDVNVISNDAIAAPSEFGFFNRVILINADKYSDEEMYYILLHEMTHFYNHTNWIKLFIDVIKCVFWWNPIMYLLERYIDNVLEIHVDEFILNKGNSDIKYIECIYNVLKKSSRFKYNTKFVKPMAAASEGRLIIKRFKLITSNNKISRFISALVMGLMVVFFIVSCRYVIQPAYDATEEDMAFPEITSENSYIVKEGDNYILYYNGEALIEATDLNELPDVKVIDK